MKRFQVRKVAVLGAGVMGAQIAAHLVNVRVPVVLFDLAAKDGPKNAVVTRAIDNLKKLRPAPLALADEAARIEAANYDEHLDKLRDCDLVIEAIVENLDEKRKTFANLDEAVKKSALFASNTSSLTITEIAMSTRRPDQFVGLHFFNPVPRMKLVEVVRTLLTADEALEGATPSCAPWARSRSPAATTRASSSTAC